MSPSDSSGPHLTPAAEAALGPLRAGIAARLGPVCADMPAAEFEDLVAQIARFTHRWSAEEREARKRRAPPPGRAD